MTTSRQELITQAVFGIAEGTAGVEGRVYRNRKEAFSRAATPAMVIEEVSNTPGTRRAVVAATRTGGTMTHSLELQVLILIDDPTHAQAADPVRVDFHDRLMDDLTLGGLAMEIIPGVTRWDLEVNGIAVISSLYVVSYRTLIKDLTSALVIP